MNFQKTPLTRALNEFAEHKILQALQLTGKALPASVTEVLIGCVTIKFELSNTGINLPNVTVPLGGVAGCEYIRVPVQVGMKGVVRPADARLGGISGLGASNSDLTPPANLSALVFEPIGNKNWDVPLNKDMLELWGPEGVYIRNRTSSFYIKVTGDGLNIQNQDGTVKFVLDGNKIDVFGPIHFHGSLIANDGLYLDGDLLSAAGGVYEGNFNTLGIVTAHVGLADQVGLTTHVHPANNTPPTPGS